MQAGELLWRYLAHRYSLDFVEQFSVFFQPIKYPDNNNKINFAALIVLSSVI